MSAALAPNATLIRGAITRIYEVFFTCPKCPQPHRIVLCAPHARRVASASGNRCFGLPINSDSCRVCALAELMKQDLAGEPELLDSLLKDLDGLMTHVLKFPFRRVA